MQDFFLKLKRWFLLKWRRWILFCKFIITIIKNIKTLKMETKKENRDPGSFVKELGDVFAFGATVYVSVLKSKEDGVIDKNDLPNFLDDFAPGVDAFVGFPYKNFQTNVAKMNSEDREAVYDRGRAVLAVSGYSEDEHFPKVIRVTDGVLALVELFDKPEETGEQFANAIGDTVKLITEPKAKPKKKKG